jgi:SNF2 family DNA or RNA helicase
VASNFTKMVKLAAREIAREFGAQSVRTLTGETSDRDRASFKDDFQDPANPFWVACLNSKAGGEAITLDQADDVIFIDTPWTDDEEQQVIGRGHRVSRIHQVTVYRLLSRGTVQEWMAGLTAEQRRIFKGASVRKLSELAMEGLK